MLFAVNNALICLPSGSNSSEDLRTALDDLAEVHEHFVQGRSAPPEAVAQDPHPRRP